MKKTYFLLLVLAFISCKTVNTSRHPLLKKTNKSYVILTKSKADEMHKYFALNIPKNWTIYFDAHNMIMYSPLGAQSTKRTKISELPDPIFQELKAEKIVEYNKVNSEKKGIYWKNYLVALSTDKDSIKVKNSNDVIAFYLKNKNVQYKNNFNCTLVKEKHDKYGEVLYFKYTTIWNFSKITHVDAIIIGKKRVYYLYYQADTYYYKYYFDDIIKIVKSIEIKE